MSGSEGPGSPGSAASVEDEGIGSSVGGTGVDGDGTGTEGGVGVGGVAGMDLGGENAGFSAAANEGHNPGVAASQNDGPQGFDSGDDAISVAQQDAVAAMDDGLGTTPAPVEGIFGGKSNFFNPTPVSALASVLGQGLGFAVVGLAALGLDALEAEPAPGTSSDPQGNPGNEADDFGGAPSGEGGDPGIRVDASGGAASGAGPTSIQSEARTPIVAQTLPVVQPLFSAPISSSLSVTAPTSPAGLAQSQIVAEQEAKQKGAAALKEILDGDPEKKGFESTIISIGSNTISDASLFTSRLFPKSRQIGAA